MEDSQKLELNNNNNRNNNNIDNPLVSNDNTSSQKTDEIDFSKHIQFIKNNKTAIILIVILILQFIPNNGYLPWGGMWMRMQIQDLPLTEKTAENIIHNNYKQQIKFQLDEKLPNEIDETKERLVEEKFKTFLSKNQLKVNEEIKQVTNQFKQAFQYEHKGVNYIYMPDVDPYVFLRYSENYLKHGHIADKVIDGKYIDNHQFAPFGKEISIKSLHPYVLVYTHKIFAFFNKNIPTMQSVSYMPVIFSLLSLIPVFFITRIFAGDAGGIFAATMLSIHASFLSRTIWGHADTDAYNVLFPLMIIWMFLLAVYSQGIKKMLIYTALSGFFLGIYSLAWDGWWYVFDIILATLIIHVFYKILINRKNIKNIFSDLEIKNNLLITTTFIAFSCIGVSLFLSFNSFFQKTLFGFLRVFTFKAASNPNLWPNVYNTVEELKSTSFTDIIGHFGVWFFFISVLGVLFTIFKRNVHEKKDAKFTILLTIWFLSTIYGSTKGVRFTMLLVPAFSIGFGIALGIVFKILLENGKKLFPINNNKTILTIFLLVLSSFIFIQPIKTSYVAQLEMPFINDAWWNALTAIKQNSNENAIITSWWDFGHHFKYLADRPVTFDGGSQNTPTAHWVGKLLLTDNETVSIGILRMLDCGIDTGIDVINNATNFTPKSVEIINKIIVKNKDEAKKILKEYKIEDKIADDILNYTHCNPPEAFLITSHDMIEKAGVWAHFGSWDFKKADLWLNVRKMEKDNAIKYLIEKYNETEDSAKKSYAEVKNIQSDDKAEKWIAPWPGFNKEGLKTCEISNEIILCKNKLLIENERPYVKTNNGKSYLQSYSYINQNGEFTVKENNKDYNGTPNINLSAILIPAKENLMNILGNPPLEKSMFSRLFFHQGHGLKHYKLFKAEKQPTGGWIYVWKVDWDGEEDKTTITDN